RGSYGLQSKFGRAQSFSRLTRRTRTAKQTNSPQHFMLSTYEAILAGNDPRKVSGGGPGFLARTVAKQPDRLSRGHTERAACGSLRCPRHAGGWTYLRATLRQK